MKKILQCLMFASFFTLSNKGFSGEEKLGEIAIEYVKKQMPEEFCEEFSPDLQIEKLSVLLNGETYSICSLKGMSIEDLEELTGLLSLEKLK